MKRLKIGLVAFVAIAAVAITIAAHGSATEKKEPVRTGFCPQGINSTTGPVTTVAGTITPSSTSCADAIEHVELCVTSYTQATSQVDCNGTNTLFCCATLETDPNCTETGKRVLAILCRPN